MNYKHFNIWSIVILITGLILLIHGIIILFYSKPVKVVFDNNSLWPSQVGLGDFSFTFVLGIGFIGIGLYRIINKNKIIARHSKWENEQKKQNKKTRKNFGIR